MAHRGDEATGGAQVDCSVLVPVLNEQRGMAECIATMRGQRFAGRVEFLLVDGRSTDETRTIIAAETAGDDRFRVLDNPSGATPSALNLGLAHARGEWVARMDAHSRYPPDYLATGIGRLRAGDTRWVSGPQLPVGHNLVSRGVALAMATPLGRGGSRRWAPAAGSASSPEYEIDSGVFCGVWPREALLAYGGWDERWLRNQDSELAGRFLAAGERLICLPAMAAVYTPRGSLRSLWRQYYQYGDYRTRTAARHPGSMRRSHLIAPSLVVAIGGAVAGPRPVRFAARGGLLAYASALVAAAARAARESGDLPAAAVVPAVLVVMHVGHGCGAWQRALRGTAPLSAIARALGLRGLSRRLAPPAEPVYAPSLSVRG